MRMTRRQEEGEHDVSAVPPSSARQVRGPQSPDDVVIAIALTATWMLTTGRHLRCDVPLLHDLNVLELIDFWADDHLTPGQDIHAGLPGRERHDYIPSQLHHRVA
jgi:hypothetical protein